jgi:hypothetical protein
MSYCRKLGENPVRMSPNGVILFFFKLGLLLSYEYDHLQSSQAKICRQLMFRRIAVTVGLKGGVLWVASTAEVAARLLLRVGFPPKVGLNNGLLLSYGLSYKDVYSYHPRG